MIAPIRNPRSSSSYSENLTIARRTVAAMLFRYKRPSIGFAPRVSSYVAWAFVSGMLAIAVSYFTLDAFWILRY